MPENARLGTSTVVLNAPEGEETVQWLLDSGWLAVADDRNILPYVVAAEPVNGLLLQTQVVMFGLMETPSGFRFAARPVPAGSA